MKSTILIFAIIATTTAINAQKPRIEPIKGGRTETYLNDKGGDFNQYTILGTNDTVQQTLFYRNGQVERKTWKKDSVYQFDALGRLYYIDYDVNNLGIYPQNFRRFNDDGQLIELKSDKNGFGLEQNFAENGRLLWTQRTIDAAGYKYTRSTDRNGVPIAATRTDTVKIGDDFKAFSHDTVYFENGRVFSICNRAGERDELGCRFFDSTGLLIKTTQADSLKLYEFKDNVECYYGLENQRGDTIVKARFDRINEENQFFLAYNGEKAILLRQDGSPMSTNFVKLTDISEINRLQEFSKEQFNTEFTDKMKRQREFKVIRTEFIVRDNGKSGVMNDKAEILMTPQYFDLTGRCVGDNKYFEFIDRNKDTFRRTGFIDRQGKSLFPDNIKGVIYSHFEDYFFLSLTPNFRQSSCGEGESEWMRHRTFSASGYNMVNGQMKRYFFNNLGFGRADGTIILEPKYDHVTHIDSCLLSVSITKNVIDAFRFDKRDGLYNFRTKKWLVDTTDFKIMDVERLGKPYFIIHHVPTDKYGIMDSKGRYILPLAYDFIDNVSRLQNTVLLKKGNLTQIATIVGDKITIQKEKYEHLTPLAFDINERNSKDALTWFVAKQKGKWGVIDAKGKTLKPFVHDYAARTFGNESSLILVKDNQATHFDLNSFPNETGGYPGFKKYKDLPNEVCDFSLLDSTKTVFFINKTGKVVIPPQYKQLYWRSRGDLVFLEDAKKQKKFVFPSTGKLIDFPFSYDIAWADPKSSVMVVKDSTLASYGVVSTDGKQLVPTKNYSVSIGDINTSTFFVKTDTPLVKRLENGNGGVSAVTLRSDSLTIEDQNWVMFDGNGKALSDKPFRFPIQFRYGVGVGAKDSDFSLFRLDGSKITVGGRQNFSNIRWGRGDNAEFYALFFTQGLTPQLVLTHLDGSLLVESGRYDGLSRFYGKYALVTKSGKVGLIDSLGNEVIAPQDLATSTAAFVDSLDVVNKLIIAKHGKVAKFNTWGLQTLPIDYFKNDATNNPDSLAITPQQRATLLNLMLQKMQPLVIETASDFQIRRADTKIGYEFVSAPFISERDNYGELKLVAVSDKTVSFTLNEDLRSYNGQTVFYNFYRTNNRWEELKVNDLLNIQGDNRWKMNDLITQKVKALKNKQIDCSNTAAFITTVENRWQLTKDGVDFCFNASGYGHELVVISLTWAELSPFLKFKIY